nr:hypothetical protein [uncultured Tyzzerella sp.]
MITNNFNSNINKNNYIYNNYNKKANNKEECETCENRKYKDGSDDAGVSFKTETKLSPAAASQAVHMHEQEHVNHERAKAAKEGREIVSQTVTIKTSTCPECGTPYVSGGQTKTITKAAPEKETLNLDDEARRGQFIDKFI